jgi:SAM-dependent methyltransferase
MPRRLNDYEQTLNALERGTLPPSRSKQFLRRAIHLLSYHFILKRRRTTVAHVAGFRLTVRPTVFHPRYFLTSKFFANFLSDIDLTGKRVADVGTGSGILALAAARAGAASVVALDINPNAAKVAAENAHANGLGKQIMAVGSNLLSALTPRPLFDVILSSSPSFAGEPRDVADRAWGHRRGHKPHRQYGRLTKHLSPAQRAALMVAQKPTDIDLERLRCARDRGPELPRVMAGTSPRVHGG